MAFGALSAGADRRLDAVSRAVRVPVAGLILAALAIRSHTQRQTWRDGVTVFEHCVAKYPRLVNARINLASALVSRGEAEAALPHLAAARGIAPTFSRVYVNLGNAFFELDALREAAANLREALRLDPKDEDARGLLGAVSAHGAAKDRLKRALPRSLAAADPAVRELCQDADELQWKGKTEEAAEHLSSALSRYPDDALVHTLLGAYMSDLGRSGEAACHYSRALNAAPDSAETHEALGNLLAHAGEHERALGHLAAALRGGVDTAVLRNNLGITLWQLGRTREAVAQYEWAVRMEPYFGYAHINLGNAWLRQGVPTRAAVHFSQALLLRPDEPRVYARLGGLAFAERDLRSAVQHFSRALDLDPQQPEARRFFQDMARARRR
jgi:tetratricopeptide (TPR) repeat protein